FKDINLKKSVPFIFVLGIVMLFVLVSSDPPTVLFVLFLLYGVSGYALWFWRWRHGDPAPWRTLSPVGSQPDADGDADADEIDDDEIDGRDDVDDLDDEYDPDERARPDRRDALRGERRADRRDR